MCGRTVVADGGARKTNHESGPVAGRRRSGDRAAVRLDEFLCDRETEPASRGPARGTAPEPGLEYVFCFLRVDPGARIRYRDLQLPRVAAAVDVDAAARRRVAHGIQQHVGNDLPDAYRVADEMRARFRWYCAADDVQR